MISTKNLLNDTTIAILDQAVVSITNFVTAIILARFLGIHEFGVYSLFFIAIILLNIIHHSLFTAPMMTHSQSINDSTNKEKYLSSVKTAQTIFAILLAVAYFATVKTLSNVESILPLHTNLIPFSLCIIAIPIQTWYKKYFFANGMALKALYLDLLNSTVQISLLGYFAATNALNIEAALYILAFASTITYLITSILHRLKFCFSGLSDTITINWSQARHLLPSYLLEWTRAQGFLIFGGVLIGVEAVGAIRAAQNIVGPLNVFYQAADNILPVEGAKRLAREGKRSMVKYFKKVGLRGISLLFLPCFLLSVSSEWILDFLYGEQFGKYYSLVIWQAISLQLAYLIKVGTSVLRTINATKYIFQSTVISSIILITIIVPLGTILSDDGIMLAKICSELASVVLIAYLIKKQLGVAS